MTTDDESGAASQMEAAMEAIREAVLRLLEAGEIDPQYVALATAGVTGRRGGRGRDRRDRDVGARAGRRRRRRADQRYRSGDERRSDDDGEHPRGTHPARLSKTGRIRPPAHEVRRRRMIID